MRARLVWCKELFWWSIHLGTGYACALAAFLPIVESAHVLWIS